MAIFGKRDKDPAAEPQLPPPDFRDEVARVEPQAAPAAPRALGREAQATTVGPTVKVKGEIAGDEDVTVEGRVEGIINLTRSLGVGKTGVVEADIRAVNVVVHGRVQGNIIAEQKVEIYPSGRLEGNIKSPKISIHEGAHFKGNVDMSGGSGGASIGTAVPPAAAPALEGAAEDRARTGPQSVPAGPGLPKKVAFERKV